MKIFQLLFLVCVLLTGCSEREVAPALSALDLAKSMNLNWWEIKLPSEINHGDNLVLYFVNASGEEVGSSQNKTIHLSSGEFVKIMMHPEKSDPFGEVVGYTITMTDSAGVQSGTLRNPLISKGLNCSSTGSGQRYEIGDMLMIFAPSESIVSAGKLTGSQIGLKTKIVNYN